MFYGCSSLTSLDLANFDTQNVENMYQMFKGCSSLTSLDLSNFQTYNVYNMEGMFSGCSSLKNLAIPGFGGEGDTDQFLNGVPMSGSVKVNKRFVDTIKRYTPKMWNVVIVDNY